MHPRQMGFESLLVSAYLQDQGKCWLISEYMSGGTLAAWLHSEKGPFGPNKTMLQRAEKALEVRHHQQCCVCIVTWHQQ